MAQAEIEETLAIDKDKLFSAVVGYEDYPQFVDGCKKVKVDRKPDGKITVTYFVSMMKDIDYTLEHTEDRAQGKVTWKLISSDFLKKNIGHWEIKEAGPGKCSVKYVIDIDFNFPVPGFILGKLVKGSLPSMLRSFEKQARKQK